MPRVMKKKDNTISRLVKDAIIYAGSKKGATYKEIRHYINCNTDPFTSDTHIKQGIRNSVNKKTIIKNGSYYRVIINPPKLRRKQSIKMMSVGAPSHPPSKPTSIYSRPYGQTMAVTFIFLIMMFSMFTAAKAESDDDDDVVGEIIIDLLTGIVLEMCTESAACSSFLTVVCIATILIGIVLTCITGECFFEMPTSRQIRRGATVYGGMRTRRWLRN